MRVRSLTSQGDLLVCVVLSPICNYLIVHPLSHICALDGVSYSRLIIGSHPESLPSLSGGDVIISRQERRSNRHDTAEHSRSRRGISNSAEYSLLHLQFIFVGNSEEIMV
ncbi:hypothetical protein H113_05988 [Trichophyton rubrum MR1459]|uniref:Uncharacterized protein n=1 Tax=Trichophyton rubrum (strain ATCC MYA-4607 / CBS 118892) TaxID=559305 RepID=A0A080WIS3_TRIRC|nr:uncharacterized protein TERG_12032 [Trichophyton rubrum CBS 118892]EZF93313.1 hypothetical protein H113_05988 [Trichophyton rubrum MR1459]EZG04100.1 hypothetical protein H106_05783 [Trichophyton rubrum CBS 735.88]KFL61289.1 hypothetical protein TERG_12032 [Trichophyton rubrum CBS 118892]